jgi:hypothetical protein
LGKKKADLENWKDCCPMDYKYGSDKDYFVPTISIASANEIEERIGEPPQTQDGADVAETGDNEAVENDEDNANMFVNFLDNFMDRKLQEHELDDHLEVNDTPYSPEVKQSASILNEPERLTAMTSYILQLSPQSSKEELLDQLTLHENLHTLYESKKLSKNMLSAYLYMTRDFRMDILFHMGSPLARGWDNHGRPLPEVWERLAKFPPRSKGLADKGFFHNGRFFPWCNQILTPPKMGERKVKQHHENEMQEKKDMCCLRYTYFQSCH